MTIAHPIDTIVNPGNSSQRYILWGNGRIDAVGGLPVTSITNNPLLWYDRLDQPVGLAIWITDWATGKGYVLDVSGGVQQLNGESPLAGSTGLANVDCTAIGLPYVPYPARTYVDWSWDPAGSGQFYVLDVFGQIYPVNGAPAPPRTGPRYTTPVARKLNMQWTPSKKAITMDMFGGLNAEFAANLTGNNAPYWPGWDAARDLAVTDWTTTPNTGYILELFGGVQTFGPSTQRRLSSGPYVLGGDNARTLNVISASNPIELFQVWISGQQFDYFDSTAPTVVCGNGVSEVQKVTITGTPTGGTFTLTFGGNTTAATAFNATASTVQTNLRALASIGSGNVTVTGGPGPGTPYTVTFSGTLALTNVAQMTSSSAFTGGSSPAIAVTTTLDGVTASPSNTITTTTRPALTWSYNDAQRDAQAQWQAVVYTQAYVSAHPIINSNPIDSSVLAGAIAYGTDTNPTTRGVVPSVDLANGGYTYYVRAQDTSGLWSAWSNRSWTQNVASPATPTGLTATADQENFLVNLSISATTGGTADTVEFQYSDDSGTTWAPVRGCEALPIATTVTGTDQDAPLGVARMYRALSYNNSPRVVSGTSNTATAMVTRQTFVLTSTTDPTLGGEINVVDKPSWTRPVKAGVFEGVGAQYPTVVSDGVPKARKISLTVDCNLRGEWDLINDLVMSNSTLVLRDPFGEVVYVRVVGDWTRTQNRRAPDASESTSLRHSHTTVLPLIEVAAPALTTVLSTVPPGPS